MTNGEKPDQLRPTPSQHNHPNGRKDDTPRWKKLAEIAAVFIALGLLVVTSLYAYFAKQQRDEMIRQNQIAGKTQWLDQRAWVTLVAAQTPELRANEPITVSLRIENSGKTPAEKLNWHFTLEIFKRGEEGKFRSGRQVIGEEMRMGPLNPNSHRSIPPIPAINQQSGKVETFTPQIAKALADGSIFIMGYGKLTYVDAWKVEHWVRFCDIPFGKPSEGFSACAEYNDIDHNEPKQ